MPVGMQRVHVQTGTTATRVVPLMRREKTAKRANSPLPIAVSTFCNGRMIRGTVHTDAIRRYDTGICNKSGPGLMFITMFTRAITRGLRAKCILVQPLRCCIISCRKLFMYLCVQTQYFSVQVTHPSTINFSHSFLFINFLAPRCPVPISVFTLSSYIFLPLPLLLFSMGTKFNTIFLSLHLYAFGCDYEKVIIYLCVICSIWL
jgi:hypothetical protein